MGRVALGLAMLSALGYAALGERAARQAAAASTATRSEPAPIAGAGSSAATASAPPRRAPLPPTVSAESPAAAAAASRISGVVVGRDGQPIAGALVIFIDVEGTRCATTRAGDGGEFTRELPSARYRLRAFAPRRERRETIDDSEVIELELGDGEQLDGVVIDSPPARAAFAGDAVAPHNGPPRMPRAADGEDD